MKNKLLLFLCLTTLSKLTIGLSPFGKQNTASFPAFSLENFGTNYVISNLNFYKKNNTDFSFYNNLRTFNCKINFSNNKNLFSPNDPKEKLFLKILKQVITLLQSKDSAGLAKFIHPTSGVYVIYRPGASDMFSNSHFINFNETIYPSVSVSKTIQVQSITYETLPEYDCAGECWSKKGCYVDTTRTDHMLSGIATALRDYFELEWITENLITELKALENKSRRIVIVNEIGESLVIYLSYFDNNWYLTIIDLVSNDCSA